VSAFERGEEELSFEELLGFVGGSDKLTLPCTADKAGNWRRLFGCLGCWQKIWGGCVHKCGRGAGYNHNFRIGKKAKRSVDTLAVLGKSKPKFLQWPANHSHG